jgi:HK97 family phage prohead protease
MNFKTIAAHAAVKDADAEPGIAEIVVSAYGNLDSDYDIVQFGASRDQIAGLYGPVPKGMLDHDWSMRSAVAKTLRLWEMPDGLHVEALYNLNKQVGREAFDDLRFFGDLMEISVGYEIKKTRQPTEEERALGARRIIQSWVIQEWSAVMLGANDQTRLVSMKSRNPRSGIRQRAVNEYRLLLATTPEYDEATRLLSAGGRIGDGRGNFLKPT